MTRQATAAPRKDRNGTWFFVTDTKGRDGRRHQAFRRGFRTKSEAQAALDALRSTSREGTFVAPNRETVEGFLTEWLETEKRKLAASTMESYQRNVRLHIIPGLGQVPLQRLDASMINAWIADLLAHGRKRGSQSPGLKPRTVLYIGTILHAALDDAVRWRRIPINPSDQADPPSTGEAKSPEMKTWSGEQVRDFLARCEGDRYYWPWLFLAMTGCRRGECLGMRWSDVDLAAGTACISQQVIPLTKASGVGREGRIVSRTKGGKARVIELDGATIAALRSWKALLAQERLLVGVGYQDHGLIFCRPDGSPFHPEQFSKTFDRRIRQEAFADLPVIRMHDLRHTWATLALAAGVDVKIVADRLGHSSPVVTWGTYQHVIGGMQSGAAEKVSSLIFGASSGGL